MTPARISKSFLNQSKHIQYLEGEREWIKSVFTLLIKVAKKNTQFTVDDIWKEIDAAHKRGSLPAKAFVDHRILGPMLRHMVGEELISSTGYYTKSMRRGGGSRPVTIWQSHLVTAKAAA